MELVSCHDSLLLGYTDITGPILLIPNNLQELVFTVMLNLDNFRVMHNYKHVGEMR